MDSYSRDSARALPVILTFFLCAAVFAGTFFALLHFVGLPQSARAQEAGEEALSPEEAMPPAEEISGESMVIATPEPQEPVQDPPEEESTVPPESEGVPVPVLGTLIETREDTVNFSFIGDILFDGNYATGSTMSARGGFANCLDAGTRELMQSADVLVANNEFTYTNTAEAFPGKTYTFRARPETVQWLKDAGVDLAALANNHVFDFQEQGLLDTLDTLDAAGVTHIGAGRDIAEAKRPAYYTIVRRADSAPQEAEAADVSGAESVAQDAETTDPSVAESGAQDTEAEDAAQDAEEGTVLLREGDVSMTVAVLNANQIERYENPETRGAGEGLPGVFRCWDPSALYEAVREAKQNADICIVFMHWGTEKESQPDWYQTSQAQGLAEAGADLIVGAHPHCLQSVDCVGGVPVFYSLGNFLFTSFTLDTGLLQVELSPEEKEVRNLRFVPMLQEGCTVRLLSGAEKERVLQEIRDYSGQNAISVDEDGNIIYERF